MGEILNINHVALIVSNLEEAIEFYEKEFSLESLPAFKFDYPAHFFKINDHQQLHITEWEDSYSFRGHVCMQLKNLNKIYWKMKELGRIDIKPWGKVRLLPMGGIQMFVRDPSGNLLELSCAPDYKIDPNILKDNLYEEGVYKSGRNDPRGKRGEKATLYHNQIPKK